MTCPPPPPTNQSESRLKTKSSSRISRIIHGEQGSTSLNLPHDKNLSSPRKTPPPPYLALRTKNLSSPQELFLSPSPVRKFSRSRFSERTEIMVDEQPPAELLVYRRRCKNKTSPMSLSSCASPRNSRRPRRRVDQEIPEDRELGLGNENGKHGKSKQSIRSRKENMSLVPSSGLPSPATGIPIENDDRNRINYTGKIIYDLIMWKDVSKSTLWFGFGVLCFLSSCFSGGLRFSVFSAISKLGLMFLILSFFHNSFSRRRINNGDQININLKEEDIVRLARVVLPVANLIIANVRKIFSGEPSMTLKVAPILLLGSEYGHSISLWRLCVSGFFISFTIPKLYSIYSLQMKRQAEYFRGRVLEAWAACSHKKIVAASLVTVFWNLTSVKTRIFTAFICIAILRYCRQLALAAVEEDKAETEEKQDEQQQALVLVDEGSQKK
ncbi:hypothetical protein C5167_008992 [Papaver somniferum]|uniref:Reticulon domain-containing protein n=1 Tax=Papaver somniferum TaxID=3469 RepID=A0A4Y7JZ13_PAPSO|nr:reticulon-like protein B17 [Papaver somniferum]RZC65302.1 hypothetical protein C5167_008992 [Papaver somniferum]